jgi:hypothetical protein
MTHTAVVVDHEYFGHRRLSYLSKPFRREVGRQFLILGVHLESGKAPKTNADFPNIKVESL